MTIDPKTEAKLMVKLQEDALRAVDLEAAMDPKRALGWAQIALEASREAREWLRLAMKSEDLI